MAGGVAVAKRVDRLRKPGGDSETAAKSVGRPSKPSKLVRLDADLVTMARRVCDYRGATVVDFLSELLRPTITQEYSNTIKELDNLDKPKRLSGG
jgi:hypothetical protein